MIKALVAILAFAGITLSGAQVAAKPAPRSAPYVEASRCPVTVKGAKLECGTLIVAEEHGNAANTRQQRLSYIRIKSSSATPANDPVVFLTGGPGSSAFYFMNVLAKSASLNKRDLIVIEQRGNGYSQPNLLCNAGDPETPEAANAAIRRCYDQIKKRGVNLDVYNLTQSAHDLAGLKQALGIAQWNVAGTSFGTFWALRYVDLHPEGVRSMVLDSPYPPQAHPDDSEIGHLNALSAIFAACRSDAKCNAAYPNLRDRFIGMVQALDKTPFKTKNSTIVGRDLFRLVNSTNFESSTVRFVPKLIDAFERQDLATITAIASLDPYGVPKGFDLRKASSAGLLINMQCVDDVALKNKPAFRMSLDEDWPAELLAAASYSSFRTDACGGYWQSKVEDAVLARPVTSSIPALIIVGALDPETPPPLGRSMAETLPHSTLIILPDAAHAALSAAGTCATGIVQAFLDAPMAKPDTACVAKQLPRFNMPDEPISIVTRR